MQHQHLHDLLIISTTATYIYSWSRPTSKHDMNYEAIICCDLQIDITMGLTKRNLELSAIKSPWPNVETTKEKLPNCVSKLYNCVTWRNLSNILLSRITIATVNMCINVQLSNSDESPWTSTLDSSASGEEWISSGEKVVPRDAITGEKLSAWSSI